MAFRSKAQRAYLYATHPNVARQFQDETPPATSLPEHVKKKPKKKRK